MIAHSEPSTLQPVSPETQPPKRTRKVRRDGSTERDKAHSLLRARRSDLIRRFQHVMLDFMLERGDCFAADVSDTFDTPPEIHRAFIGTAVVDLCKSRMISRTGERRSTTQGGRHGNIYEVWRLAPGVDAIRVEEWKRTHPLPPTPDVAIEQTAAT